MIPAFIIWDRNRQSDHATVHVDGSVIKEKKHPRKRVIRAKGGQQPQLPSPAEEAEAQIRIEEERRRRAQEDAERERIRLETERKEKIRKAGASQTAAYNDAAAYGENELARRGISDDFGVMSAYMAELNRIRSGLAEDDMTSASRFGTEHFDNVWNRIEGQQRGKNLKSFDTMYTPDFARDRFADNSDDAILDAILGEQRGMATQSIDAARARGALTGGAYDRARVGLDTAGRRGRAQLEDIGLSVLDSYRSQLTDAAARGRTQVQNYNLGDQFSMDTHNSRIGGMENSFRGRMEGDILNRVGDMSFFDVPSIISRGRVQAGLNNPAPILAATQQQLEEQNKKNLGTLGTF